MRKWIDELIEQRNISFSRLCLLLRDIDEQSESYLFSKARQEAQSRFGNRIYIRALIEFSNYCRNDCYYCGIRRSNKKVERYRLTEEDILSCCKTAYDQGFRTFVLQGGEDLFFDVHRMSDLIRQIKQHYPKCALTLSLGEKTEEEYQHYFDAGADRYLLRHETSCPDHYAQLHPKKMCLSTRVDCLLSLQKMGYQVGSGMMIGSPFQTVENLAHDLLFLKKHRFAMVGMGPYLPHKDTPFHHYPKGDFQLCLRCIAIVRLLLPDALIPATTALATLDEMGRIKGILAGANVVMPNVSPPSCRQRYTLYDHKANTGKESIEGIDALQEELRTIGYEITCDRGDYRERME